MTGARKTFSCTPTLMHLDEWGTIEIGNFSAAHLLMTQLGELPYPVKPLTLLFEQASHAKPL
jgi:hypothetical protein